MRERPIRIQELHANLSRCLERVQSGTTLLLTDGGHRVARLIPESEAGSNDGPPIAWSRRRLKKTRPKARLRGEGSMADIVRENRR
jgi:antitoxin (DNA-binding transcriptional repressor) of toxin-antitoxin stability system